MAKLLLVEDDNNLREIYEARLQAEGYTIVSAKDGEEALVVAKAEKPDLIISDVMMPKISGFEMLDILRNTPEIQATKVIMLTALGQTEDQSRANKLGADRYLVKSQVTLEDIVKAAHELLEDETTAPEPTPAPVDPQPAPVPQPTPAPVDPQPAPINVEQTTNEIEQNLAQSEAQENNTMQNQINEFLNSPAQTSPVPNPLPTQPVVNSEAQQSAINQTSNDQTLAQAVNDLISGDEQPQPSTIAPTIQPQPATPPSDAAPNEVSNNAVDISGKKVIQPIGNTGPQKSLEDLVAQEEANNIMTNPINSPATPQQFDPTDPNNVAL